MRDILDHGVWQLQPIEDVLGHARGLRLVTIEGRPARRAR